MCNSSPSWRQRCRSSAADSSSLPLSAPRLSSPLRPASGRRGTGEVGFANGPTTTATTLPPQPRPPPPLLNRVEHRVHQQSRQPPQQPTPPGPEHPRPCLLPAQRLRTRLSTSAEPIDQPDLQRALAQHEAAVEQRSLLRLQPPPRRVLTHPLNRSCSASSSSCTNATSSGFSGLNGSSRALLLPAV